jgi:hypothetical protein
MLATIIAWIKRLFSTKKLGILLVIFAKKTVTPVI